MPGFFRASLWVMTLGLVAWLGIYAVAAAALIALTILPVLVITMLPRAVAGVMSWFR